MPAIGGSAGKKSRPVSATEDLHALHSGEHTAKSDDGQHTALRVDANQLVTVDTVHQDRVNRHLKGLPVPAAWCGWWAVGAGHRRHGVSQLG